MTGWTKCVQKFFRSGLERIQLGTTPKGTEKIEYKGNREFDSLEKSLFTLSHTLTILWKLALKCWISNQMICNDS